MYFIGIESAESVTRVVVVDLESSVIVASSSRTHALVEGVPIGHQEQNPHLWISCLDQAVKECLASLGESRHHVLGMAVAAQSQASVLLDESNQVIRPAKIAGDRAACKQLDRLNRNFGGSPGLTEILGNRLHPDDPAPKLLWLKERESAHFRKAVSIMQPREFLNFWLTGLKVAEAGEASRSGLFDVPRRQWSSPMMAFIDPRLAEKLSPLARPENVLLGPLRPEVARSWGLRPDILVSLGSGLDMMRALSLGNVAPGTAVLDFGATAAIRGPVAVPAVDPRSEASLWCDATGRWLSHFHEERAVSSYEMVRNHYRWSGPQMEQAASGARPGADGLMVLPLGHGSHGGKGEGIFHGITTMNFSPDNVARATIEGIALGLAFGFHRMVELGHEFTSVRVAGRGAASTFWRQLVADVTGVPACPLRRDDGTALGAAIHAAVAFSRQGGETFTFAEVADHLVHPDPDSQCEPDAERHEFYLGQLSRQQYLAETLVGSGFLV